MATDGEAFFASPQGAAIMKHVVLGAYIRLFVNKLGSTHDVVHYLDGYAGPGVYGDGSQGSPMLAATVAELVAEIRDLRCTFVEQDAAFANELEELMARELPSATVISGKLQEHVEDIVLACNADPLLAFIDPFGLAIPFDQLMTLCERTNKKTDIIMNVSLSALRRGAGHLTSTSTDPTYLKARVTLIKNMDEVLGGDWWHEIWTQAHSEGSDQGAIRIARAYAQRCRSLRGGYFIAGVKDRWDGPPAYMLMLLAGHRDAFWNFNEFMSLAYDKLRELDPRGQLIPYQGEYPAILEKNVRTLVAKRNSVLVESNLTGIFGGLLGIARGTHLRPVLKKLCADGVIVTTSLNAKRMTVHNGQGDLQHMRIERTAHVGGADEVEIRREELETSEDGDEDDRILGERDEEEWDYGLDPWEVLLDNQGNYRAPWSDDEHVGAVWKDRWFSPEQAEEWASLDFQPDEAEAWRAVGLDPEGAASWSSAGFSSSDVGDWLEATDDPNEAAEWSARGFCSEDFPRWASEFSPEEAERWIAAGFEAEEAEAWAFEAIAPTRAAELRDRGLSPEDDLPDPDDLF